MTDRKKVSKNRKIIQAFVSGCDVGKAMKALSLFNYEIDESIYRWKIVMANN